ncbi:MAG TPA: ShlB/FhaC/HecB family hemolysin secretion/activation protein, partial [Rhizomicrobium sp.]
LWGAIVIAFCTPGLAQTSAEPGHVDERFRQPPPPPTLGAPVEIPIAPQSVAPSDSQKVPFTLSGVSFEGNNVLPTSQLQALAASYVGRSITLADVYELADRITAAYRAAGYILVRAIVPAQTVSSGHLTLRIVEGYIDQVKVQGDAGGAKRYLEAYGRRIAAAKPLTAKVLERELLLASDISGFNVRSVLTPSATVQGAADLTLVVERKPVDAFLSVDNRGSKFLGPYQVMGGVFFNDVFGTAGRFGINAVVTPDQGPDLAYGAVSYNQPIGINGLRLFASASYVQTRPGSVLRALDTKGRATNADLALSFPFVRSRDFNLVGSLGAAYHDVQSSNFSASPLFSDHVRSLNANVFLNALDDWGGYSTASASVTQGLEILGATRSGSTVKSRVGASGDFTRANFEVTHEQPLISRFSAMVGLGAQTSFGGSLLSSEQFSLGGSNYNRAFDPSEVTGDSALAGKAELRWDILDRASIVSGVQLYGFYETGEVWQAKALPGTPKSQTLSSTGAGIRFAVADHFSTDLEWAKPLNTDVLGA